MAAFEENGAALEEPTAPRGSGLRLAELGSRLTRPFSRSGDATGFPPAQDEAEQGPETAAYEAPAWQDDVPRFAVVRHGYHCAAVDEYVAELEQELGELDREIARLRCEQPEPDAVAAVIKRVGEQTSEVLIAAHRQAEQTIRDAEAEAQARLAAAESEAHAIASAAKQRLCELEEEMIEVHRQRARLLGDVSSAATALTELVEVSFERFPTEVDVAPAATDKPASDNSEEPS